MPDLVERALVVNRRGTWRVAAVCGLALVGAVAAVVLCPPASTEDPTTSAVAAQVGLIGAILGAAVVATAPAGVRTRAVGITLLLAIWLALAATLTLSANDYGPFGAGVDQSFRTAYLTKLAAHWGPTDFAYRDLPWFYPPTYFWLLGRVAGWWGVDGWKMLKVGVIVAGAVVPLANLGLWSRIVSWRAATAVAIGSLVVQEWYAPYEWIVAVVFVPWWILLWRLERPPRTRMIVLGAVGALIISTYYYYVLIGALALLVVSIVRTTAARLDVRPADTRAVFETLGWSALLSAWYWGPLLRSALDTGTWDPLQHRFFGVGFVSVPLPFLTFDLVGVVLLGGLAFLVLNAARDPVARVLAMLLAAAYAWYLLDAVAVVVGVPLLSQKTTFLVTWILAAAALLGVVQVVDRLRTERRTWLRPACVLGLAVGFALAQAVPGKIPYVDVQREERYPRALLAGYRGSVGGEEKVVLTDVIVLDLYLPNVYLFNAWNANYANPVAGFSDRARMVERLGHELDPDVFALVLGWNRYDPITEIVFRRGVRTYTYADDDFPNGTKDRTVHFHPDVFAGFTQHVTADLEILVPPSARLREASCAVVRDTLRRFEGDLLPSVRDRARACAASAQ